MSRPFMSWRKSRTGTPFAGIGALEAEVLAAVWKHEPAPVSVRVLYNEFSQERPIARTTVMTVLGNLVKKGLLARDESEATYLYRAAISEDEVGVEILESVVSILYRGRRPVATSHLLGLESELSDAQLEELRICARRLLES